MNDALTSETVATWDSLITEESSAVASCAVCPHFCARGTGRDGIASVMRGVERHAELGREHSISIHVSL